MISRFQFLPLYASLTLFILPSTSHTAENAAPVTGPELAASLSSRQQNGTAYVRLKMEIKGASNQTLQLQIKERRTKESSEIVYQVLFPKERKGESVLLRKTGNSTAKGNVFIPPNSVDSISNLKESLFGSNLSYEDVIENFFAWDHQTIVGTEKIDGAFCQILESKPGKGERSSYGSVKSWIDTRRLVPLQIEKYSSSGQLIRKIVTTRVVTEEGHHIPANLSVSGVQSNSSTIIEGSRIKSDVNLTDLDFTTEGIKELTVPR